MRSTTGNELPVAASATGANNTLDAVGSEAEAEAAAAADVAAVGA